LRVLTVQPRCRKQRNPAVQLALSNLCNQYLPERRKAERLYDLVCVRLVSSGRPPQRARCCTVCVCYAFTESGLPTRAWFFGRTRTCSSSTSSNTEWFLQASLQKKKKVSEYRCSQGAAAVSALVTRVSRRPTLRVLGCADRGASVPAHASLFRHFCSRTRRADLT